MRHTLPGMVLMLLVTAGASGSPLLQQRSKRSETPPVMRQDTIVVRAPAQGQWGEDVRLVEDLRIGVLEGEPAYMFGYVSDLAVGRDRSLYILDDTGIRQYDRQGRFVRQIGEQGQGPGEYGRIQGIEVLPDGRLTIWTSAIAASPSIAPRAPTPRVGP